MRYLPLAALLVAMQLVSGCDTPGLPTYPVLGKVEFEDGTPVRSGYVEAFSREHRINARGKIQPDGTFQLTTFQEADGAVAGGHDLIVVQFLGHERAPDVAHNHGEAVATKYSDYATSGLSLEVGQQPENQCVITVSKKR